MLEKEMSLEDREEVKMTSTFLRGGRVCADFIGTWLCDTETCGTVS